MCLQGHAVMPMLHPSGEVHNLVVPADQPLPEFHDTLSDYYHDPEPTKEGALEYSPGFRKAAQMAITASSNFTKPGEAGFGINASGTPAHKPNGEPVIQFNPGSHHLSVFSQPDDKAVFHTHPNVVDPEPSPGDIESAKKTGKVIYVASRGGLWAVGPDGKKIQVFKRDDWATRKKPE